MTSTTAQFSLFMHPDQAQNALSGVQGLHLFRRGSITKTYESCYNGKKNVAHNFVIK